jgi:hypothetical protein
MAAMNSRVALLTFTLALAGLFLASRHHLQADVRGPQSLTTLVGTRSLTRDTNGDGLADAVARVIVSDSPTIGEVEAATNFAARLGYETTARYLGPRNHEPGHERAGVAGEALRAQADDLHHWPAARHDVCSTQQ